MGNTLSRPDLKGFCFFNGGFVYEGGSAADLNYGSYPF